MVRTRKGWLVAVALVAMGGAACKKAEDKKTDQTAAADKGGDKADKGGDKGGMAAPAKAGAVPDDLGLLPADSDVVIGLNFSQLQQSPLWKQFSPKIMAKMASGLSDVQTACGFNPMDTIKSGAIGLKGVGGGGEPNGTIVIHGLDKSKVMGCMDKAKTEAAKHDTVIAVDGDVITVSNKDKPDKGAAVLQFTSGDTLLGVFGPGATKDTLAAATKGGGGAKGSATFVEIFGKINAADTLWYMVNGNAPFMAKMGSMGAKPTAAFGSLAVTDGLALDARIRFASADEATQVVAMLKSQVSNPMVKGMFDKLDVNPDGADVKFGIAMSQQKLTALAAQVGGMMGGMGGGGMGGAPAAGTP